MKKTYSLLLIILLTLSLSSCYQLFQGKIPMNNAKPGTTLDEVMQEKEKISQLKAPSQIFVSQGLLCDKIEISWSAVDYASNYRLERAVKNASDTKLPEDSDFEVIKASGSSILSSSYVSGTKYTDLILPNPSYTSEEYNKIYYYRVSAENPQAGYTSSDYAVSEKAFLFSPVPNVSASAGESEEEVTVTWNAVPKASWYNIYRSADSTNANPVLLSTVSGNVFQYSNKIGTSEQGLDFYYTVKAVNANNHSSVTSAVSLGYALKNGAPSRVTGVKISNGKGRGDGPASDGIEVSWTSAGADTKYTVFRYSSKDSSITQLATGLTATSVVDKKALKPNVYYYYKVLAYKTVSNGTTNEDIKGPMSTDTAEGFIISPPEDIAVNKIGSRCEIKFSQTIGEKGFLSDSGNSTDYNTYSYIIKGGNDQNDISQTVTFEEVYPVNGYYTVIANEYYKFYQIFAKNDKGKESAASSIVAPSPSPCQNVKATKAAFIEGEMTVATSNHNNTWTGANANEVFPVKITWEAPKDGADGGYHVYRSTEADGAYRRITENPVTTLFYVDRNDTAKAGIYYYYKVLALNSLGNGTNYSDSAMGYGALTYNQFMREYNKTIQRSQKKLTLMHKSAATDKLGTETINGDISGTLYYNAGMEGLGGRVIMKYTNYIDYNVKGTSSPYFLLDGNTNTSANISSNGTMDGVMTCSEQGMYPGTIVYDHVEIKSGSAGGGYYTITPKGFPAGDVDYTVGNEGW